MPLHYNYSEHCTYTVRRKRTTAGTAHSKNICNHNNTHTFRGDRNHIYPKVNVLTLLFSNEVYRYTYVYLKLRGQRDKKQLISLTFYTIVTNHRQSSMWMVGTSFERWRWLKMLSAWGAHSTPSERNSSSVWNQMHVFHKEKKPSSCN